MAKSTRRARKRKLKRLQTDENNAPETAHRMSKKQSKAAQFRQEYAYVLKDLRRIFALAAVMFILLIMLNLLLQ